MVDQPQQEALAAVNGFRGDLAQTMGIIITEASTRRVCASMPVAGNTQPFGLLHGGASAVLAETVGSIAAAIHGGPDHAPVGVTLFCTHHKAARDGSVHAVAEPVRLGRGLTSHQIQITDDNGNLICTAQLTCLLRRQEAP